MFYEHCLKSMLAFPAKNFRVVTEPAPPILFHLNWHCRGDLAAFMGSSAEAVDCWINDIIFDLDILQPPLTHLSSILVLSISGCLIHWLISRWPCGVRHLFKSPANEWAPLVSSGDPWEVQTLQNPAWTSSISPFTDRVTIVMSTPEARLVPSRCHKA